MRITSTSTNTNGSRHHAGWPFYALMQPLLAGMLSVGLGVQTLSLSAQTAPPANSIPQSSKGAAASPPPPSGKQKSANRVQVGPNLTITDYSRASGDLANVDLSGPDIHLDSVEPEINRKISIIANHATATLSPASKRSAVLTENVRYTITEKITVKTEHGERSYERITEGTAHQATYQETTRHLRLIGGVDAKVIDPEQFDGPARLHAGSLVIPVPKDQAGKEGKKTSEPVGRYEVEGDASTNSVTFTPHVQPPKPTPPAKSTPGVDASKPDSKPKAKATTGSSEPGTIHIHHFDTGTLVVGEQADFRGKQVVVETVNAKEKTQNILKAPHIVAKLTPGARDMDASGGVQFDSRSTLQYEKRAVTQILAGTAEHALWKQDAPLVVDGHIDATLTNPATLLEPATLVADHLVADLGDKPRYVVTGSIDTTRLAFAPRPSEAKPTDKKSKAKPVTKENTTKDAVEPVQQGNKIVVNAGNPQKPEQKPEQKPDKPADLPTMAVTPFVIGKVVVTRFQTATYEPEKGLVVSGPQIRFVSDDPKTQNYAEILTPHFEADLDQTDNTLTESRATNGVAYRFRQLLPPQKDKESEKPKVAREAHTILVAQQPAASTDDAGKKASKKGEEFQIVTGKGREMTFKNDPDSQIITVQGVIENDIINPQKFADAAHLSGSKTNSTADMTYEMATQHFEVTDPDKQTSIAFTPLPPPAKKTDDSQSKKPAGRNKKNKNTRK